MTTVALTDFTCPHCRNAGALATPFVLKPGESRTVTFVLTWYFPNIPMVLDEKCPKWDHDGYAYAARWPDGLTLAKDVLARFDTLSEQTRRFHKTFYASNLPHWLLDRILSQVRQPVILHWLGEMFDPALAGYWGKNDHLEAMEVCLSVLHKNRNKVDGIKISLLDKDKEIAMRRRLPPGVRMYTGDDFNFAELIEGDALRRGMDAKSAEFRLDN
mgnify:CR=1 FL=1